MSFFTTLSPGRFTATDNCGGPWDPALQHAGPPEALIAREMRRAAGREDALLARLTFELLGPIPVGEVGIEVSVARPRSKVQMARPRMPLVDDELLTGWDRLLLLADSANGVSATLDLEKWFFIPPETTLHLLREPRGDWVHLEAATTIAATGPGVARGTLSDELGTVGFVSQSLLVAPRHRL